MESRALFPSGAFLLSLLLLGLLLLHSDFSPDSGGSDGLGDGGWVRLARGGEEGSFYRFLNGDRLDDLLQREMPGSGIVLSDACSKQSLIPGTVIHLSTGEVKGPVSCRVSALPGRHRYLMGMPMNVNRAGKEDLVLLPGVGNALAERILEAREARQGFSTVEDLVSVRGIGRKLLEKVRRHITVEP